jgi:hypothetical protein
MMFLCLLVSLDMVCRVNFSNQFWSFWRSAQTQTFGIIENHMAMKTLGLVHDMYKYLRLGVVRVHDTQPHGRPAKPDPRFLYRHRGFQSAPRVSH